MSLWRSEIERKERGPSFDGPRWNTYKLAAAALGVGGREHDRVGGVLRNCTAAGDLTTRRGLRTSRGGEDVVLPGLRTQTAGFAGVGARLPLNVTISVEH